LNANDSADPKNFFYSFPIPVMHLGFFPIELFHISEAKKKKKNKQASLRKFTSNRATNHLPHSLLPVLHMT